MSLQALMTRLQSLLVTLCKVQLFVQQALGSYRSSFFTKQSMISFVFNVDKMSSTGVLSDVANRFYIYHYNVIIYV